MQQSKKKKFFLMVLMIVLSLTVVFGLFACDSLTNNIDDKGNEKEVVQVDVENIPNKIYVGEFFNVGITLKATYEDGTFDLIPFTQDMLPKEYEGINNTVGKQLVIFSYNGKDVSFRFEMIPYPTFIVNFYNEFIFACICNDIC